MDCGLNLRLLRVQSALDQIYDDKIDGLIDLATYQRKKAKLVEEQENLEGLIRKHRKADSIYTDLGCLVIDVAERVGQIYEVRKSEEKRYLSNFVFSNLFLEDKKLQFSFKFIFQAILKYQKTKDWLAVYRKCRTSFC